MEAEGSEKHCGQQLERPFPSTSAQTVGEILSSDWPLRLQNNPQAATVSNKPQTKQIFGKFVKDEKGFAYLFKHINYGY